MTKDILAGWTLHKCDDGTYDAKGPCSDEPGEDCSTGYDYHNLGNGRTSLSAWTELYDLLCDRQTVDQEQELEDLDKHCPTCTCSEHST